MQLSIYYLLFSDFVQSTRYIKQKDTSPLQGFSTCLPITQSDFTRHVKYFMTNRIILLID